MQNTIKTVQGQYSLVGQPDTEHVSILYNTQSCIRIPYTVHTVCKLTIFQFPQIYSSYNHINKPM